jgi:predicted component of type VI protein secretion system
MAQLQVALSQDSQFAHELSDDKTTIGRIDDNTLCIPHDSVSSHHAEIVFEGDLHHLHDLGSTNGTFVNGEQVTDAILHHGDEVRFGAIPCAFHADEEAGGDAQPMPRSSAPATHVANQSARPTDFVSSSPIPRNVKTGDPVGMAAVVLGILALLACAGAAAMAFLLTA